MVKKIAVWLVLLLLPLPAAVAEQTGALPMHPYALAAEQDVQPTITPTASLTPDSTPAPTMSLTVPTKEVPAKPTAAPLPAPYQYRITRQSNELSEVQRKLALAGFYGNSVTVDLAATGQPDKATNAAVRAYLSVIYADPQWRRDYLTQEEYFAFVRQGNELATPTPLPSLVGSSPTASPAAFQGAPSDLDDMMQGFTPPATPAGRQAHALLQAAVHNSPPAPATHPASSPVPNTLVLPEAAVHPEAVSPPPQGSPVPLTVTDTPKNTTQPPAKEVPPLEVTYSRRHEQELKIRGTINSPEAVLELVTASGERTGKVIAGKDGAFAFSLTRTDRPQKVQNGDFLLIVDGNEDQKIPLQAGDVRQETLLSFTGALGNSELLMIGITLLLLGAALLAAAAFIRKRGRRSR